MPMKFILKRHLGWLVFFFFLGGANTLAQPFIEDIQAFKRQDSATPPPASAILFVGSSSFTLWKDVYSYFPGKTIINRGFGGSSLTDLIRYAGDVIYPYTPKQIVIYCGENDFAANDSLFPAQVAERFFELFRLIRQQFKKVPIAYISMKPSVAREHLMPKFNVANVMIKEFLKKKKRTAFIDVYHKMLNSEGKPIAGLFVEDQLHMNAKGYAIWQREIEQYLVK